MNPERHKPNSRERYNYHENLHATGRNDARPKDHDNIFMNPDKEKMPNRDELNRSKYGHYQHLTGGANSRTTPDLKDNQSY